MILAKVFQRGFAGMIECIWDENLLFKHYKYF